MAPQSPTFTPSKVDDLLGPLLKVWHDLDSTGTLSPSVYFHSIVYMGLTAPITPTRLSPQLNPSWDSNSAASQVPECSNVPLYSSLSNICQSSGHMRERLTWNVRPQWLGQEPCSVDHKVDRVRKHLACGEILNLDGPLTLVNVPCGRTHTVAKLRGQIKCPIADTLPAYLDILVQVIL